MKRNKLWFLLVTLDTIFLLVACVPRSELTHPASVEATSEHRGSATIAPVKPSVPMDVGLLFSAPPLLDEVVNLTFWVRPMIDAPNTTVRIALPEGFQTVGGQLNWQEDISANEVKEFQVQVRAVKTGLWTITAEAISQLCGGATFGKSVSLYAHITETCATVSDDAKQR